MQVMTLRGGCTEHLRAPAGARRGGGRAAVVAGACNTERAGVVEAASGMGGANYEFSLMEFIRATRDAYDEGIMVPALNLELSMCQRYTAGRPLQADEIDLRTVWLSHATQARTVKHSRDEAKPPQAPEGAPGDRRSDRRSLRAVDCHRTW